MPYQTDAHELYWDLIYLMTSHYSDRPDAFRRACESIIEKVRREDPTRATWLAHMVQTGSVPTREWEDELWTGMKS